MTTKEILRLRGKMKKKHIRMKTYRTYPFSFDFPFKVIFEYGTVAVPLCWAKQVFLHSTLRFKRFKPFPPLRLLRL
jgi:hypothetical protein